MKPLRLVSTPTRNRRLNGILGLVLLVCAALLFLALATYTSTDPSANTVGGLASATRNSSGWTARLAAGPAHNWTGLVGAWAGRPLPANHRHCRFLSSHRPRVGLASAGCDSAPRVQLPRAFLASPSGSSSLRRPSVSLPHTLYWRHALPIEGVTGRLLADAMVHYLNLPGASIVLALMVVMPVYLATDFLFPLPPASGWTSTSPCCAASSIA